MRKRPPAPFLGRNLQNRHRKRSRRTNKQKQKNFYFRQTKEQSSLLSRKKAPKQFLSVFTDQFLITRRLFFSPFLSLRFFSSYLSVFLSSLFFLQYYSVPHFTFPFVSLIATRDILLLQPYLSNIQPFINFQRTPMFQTD